MINIDHGTTLDGVGAQTARKDNTRTQRIKALKVLTDQGWGLSEAMGLLGIPLEWVETPDPEYTPPQATGTRWKRNHYNGPARLT